MGFSKLITIEQLAKSLGVSRKTVLKWLHQYDLSHVKIGGSYWLRPEAVEAWLTEHTIVSSSHRQK